MEEKKLKVLAMDVSKGKSFIVLYDDKTCIHEQEIYHNQEGFGCLKRILTDNTTQVVFEATGVYSRQIESFLNKESIPYCMMNPLLAKKQTDALRGNKTDRVDVYGRINM